MQEPIKVIKYFSTEITNMANKQKLEGIVTARSVAGSFDQARTEWRLSKVEYSDKDYTCICDHPIHKLCWIENKHNKNKLLVGSTCVTKFINKNLMVDKLFVGLDKLNKAEDDGCPKIVYNYAHEQGYINDWELSFVESLGNRYGVNLTEKQYEHRQKIHQKILVSTGYRRRVIADIPTVKHLVDKPVLKK